MQITAMKKDDFYRQMFKLTIPIIIQNLLSAAVNSADVIMLNYVGQSAISAVSLASNFSNVLFMVYYGLGTGATLLCAQYYGKGNLEAIHTVEGITLRFSMAISGIVALIAFFLPQKIIAAKRDLIEAICKKMSSSEIIPETVYQGIAYLGYDLEPEAYAQIQQ